MKKIPIALQMVLSISLVGALILTSVFLHEQADLREFFGQHARMMLEEGGEDDHDHLEQYLQDYVAAATVYGQSHPVRGYVALNAPAWRTDRSGTREYVAQLPLWLSQPTLLDSLIHPRIAFLLAEDGSIREIYRKNRDDARPDLLPITARLQERPGTSGFLMNLGEALYWIAATEVGMGEARARLVMADPLDHRLLQAAVNPSASARSVAIVEVRSERVLASSHPDRIAAATPLSALSATHLISTRKQLNTLATDQEIGFISLLPLTAVDPIVDQLLRETTEHGLMYGAAFLFSATLVAFYIGSKLRNLARELTTFTEISLGAPSQVPALGDELHLLQETSRELQKKVVQDRALQTASYEDLAMHMHISHILRTGSGHREVLEMSLDVLLNLVELNPLRTGCVLYLRAEREVIFTERIFQIIAQRGDLPDFVRELADLPERGRCLYLRLGYGDDIFSASECLEEAAWEEPRQDVQTWIVPLKHANQLFGALILLSRQGVVFSLDRFRALRLVGETIAAHLHAESLTNSLRERHQALASTLEEMQFATNSLRLSQNRLSGILAMLPALFIEVNRSGVVSQWNRMASRLMGIQAEQAIGQSFRSLPIQWEWDCIMHMEAQAQAQGTSQHLPRFPCRLPGHRDGMLDLTITPMHLEEFGGYFLMGTDITERTRMEMRLAQAQKMEAIGTLAAGIAHEINTPTQFIGDNTHFLKEAFEDQERILQTWRALGVYLPPEVMDAKAEAEALEESKDLPYLQTEIPMAIRQILQGVERISSIVRAMKDFSYPDQGMLSKVDINKAIMDTVTIARNEYKYVAELETDLSPDLPLVPGYRNELNQAFLNILVNAAHTIGEKNERMGIERGRIAISSRLEGEEVVLRFSDSGMGVPENIRQRIFEPFFTTKPVGKGTGQGLAIVHSVVVGKHGGAIHVESEPGEGTQFILHLPLNEERLASQRKGENEAA